MPGKKYGNDLGIPLLDLGKHGRAIHLGHSHVGKDQGESSLPVEDFQSFHTIGGEVQFKILSQVQLEPLEDRFFVIHAKDFIVHGLEWWCLLRSVYNANDKPS